MVGAGQSEKLTVDGRGNAETDDTVTARDAAAVDGRLRDRHRETAPLDGIAVRWISYSLEPSGSERRQSRKSEDWIPLVGPFT